MFASMVDRGALDALSAGEKLNKLDLDDTSSVSESRPPGLTNTVWGMQALVQALRQNVSEASTAYCIPRA